jgi:hypothetical protein
MEITEHLKLTDQEREFLRGKKACISKPSDGKVVVTFAEHDVYGTEPLAGGYEQILQYLMSLYPAQVNCQQVFKEFSGRHHARLVAYTRPCYGGDSIDEAAALLTKYKRIRVASDVLQEQLKKQFPFLEFNGDFVSMISQASRKQTLKRRHATRVRKGLVSWNAVSCLYWNIENKLSRMTRGYLEIRGWCWPRDIGGYMDRIPKLDAFATKVGVHPDREQVRAMKKYIPGLLKHKHEDFRNFGKWLQRKLRRKHGKGKA